MSKSNKNVGTSGNKKGRRKRTYLKEAILKFIEEEIGQKNLIAFPREFINYTGNLDSAIFLSQLLYWSDRAVRFDGAVYKKYEDWHKEIGLSEYEIKRSVRVLREKGILETKLKKAHNAPTLHYYLDSKKFESSFQEFLRNQKIEVCEEINEKVNNENQSNLGIDSEENSDSLTDTTTEITTEIRESGLSNDNHTSPSNFRFVEESGTANKEDREEVCSTGSNVQEEEEEEDRTLYDIYWDTMERLENQGISQKPIPIPDDFEPDYNMRFWAHTNYPLKLIGYATEKFVDYFKSNGKKSCNWKLKWKKWIEDEREIPYHLLTGEQYGSKIGEYCDHDLDSCQLFEEFLSGYSPWGLVPLTYIYEAFPHLLTETIQGALNSNHLTRGFVVIQEQVYSKYLYEQYEEYKTSVDKDIAALN